MTNASPQHFDLCIIGAGAAGLSVAAGAAQLGLHVALIEEGNMGGDCLNTGCIPSKSLLAAAKTVHTVRTAENFGITSPAPDINFAGVKKHINTVIKTIEPHDSQERFEGLGVTVIREKARFTGHDTIQTKTHNISARHFVVATGSSPVIPPINGLDHHRVLTNENIFGLKDRPAHLVIIGGGPIGIEMAQGFKRLGSKVTVIDQATILPRDDPDLANTLRMYLTDTDHIRLHENSKITKAEHTDEGVSIYLTKDNGDEYRIDGSHLLVAAGRKPNIDTLALEKAGVTTNKKGIITDKRLRTANKHIYAAGDVIGGPQFTHIAAYHAGIIIRNLIFKIPAKINYSALPWVTYTAPELAQVGVTAIQAQEKYRNIKILTWKFSENDRAIAEQKTEGEIKVITRKNGRIIGASILGAHAGELIGMWSLAISQGLKIGAVANIIAPYPTFTEINKRAAGSYYTTSLFSDKTRFITGLLRKIPI